MEECNLLPVGIPFLKFRRITPKIPPKFSCASAGAQLRTNGTLTRLTSKIWVYKFDDDKEKPRVEFKYSTTEEEVHYISDKWNTIEKASFCLSNTIDKVFDDTKVGKISDGKYIILKDVFEDIGVR